MEAQYVKVAELDQLPEGSTLLVELEDQPKICLANSDGEI